jgi:hypothetical protein
MSIWRQSTSIICISLRETASEERSCSMACPACCLPMRPTFADQSQKFLERHKANFGSGSSEWCESRGPPTAAITSLQLLLLPLGISERIMGVCSGYFHLRFLSIEGQQTELLPILAPLAIGPRRFQYHPHQYIRRFERSCGLRCACSRRLSRW